MKKFRISYQVKWLKGRQIGKVAKEEILITSSELTDAKQPLRQFLEFRYLVPVEITILDVGFE